MKFFFLIIISSTLVYASAVAYLLAKLGSSSVNAFSPNPSPFLYNFFLII